jgi:hypothetical protein
MRKKSVSNKKATILLPAPTGRQTIKSSDSYLYILQASLASDWIAGYALV